MLYVQAPQLMLGPASGHKPMHQRTYGFAPPASSFASTCTGNAPLWHCNHGPRPKGTRARPTLLADDAVHRPREKSEEMCCLQLTKTLNTSQIINYKAMLSTLTPPPLRPRGTDPALGAPRKSCTRPLVHRRCSVGTAELRKTPKATRAAP